MEPEMKAPRELTATQGGDWSSKPLSSLIDHLVQTHHAFCKTGLARLPALIADSVQKHGATRPELLRIRSVFTAFSRELAMHLVKEEDTLFPYIKRLEETVDIGRPFPRPAYGTIANPIGMMIYEHEGSDIQLKEIRRLTAGYQLPPDADEDLRMLYESLGEFERDMRTHTDVENTVLFPRTVALEQLSDALQDGN